MKSLDYLHRGAEGDAGGDRRPSTDRDSNAQDASLLRLDGLLDTHSPVTPDGAREVIASLDAGTSGLDSHTVDGSPATDLAGQDAPAQDGLDVAPDSPVLVDSRLPPLDGGISPTDSSVTHFDARDLGLDSTPPLPDGSVPIFDSAAAAIDTDSPVAPDLAGPAWDSRPELPPDLARDSASPDASTHSAEIYFETGATNVGTTYTNSFDLGSEPNRLLVVGLAWDAAAVGNPVMTYAGNAMTLAEKDIVNSQALAIYYAVGPPVGVGELIATFSSSVNLSVVILGLRNVNQTLAVSAKGMTSANWAVLISGGYTVYDGSLALVFDIATTGNNEVPTVTGAPYSLHQTVLGRPSSPYLSVGAGTCSTAGAYNWTFSHSSPHWHGIAMLEIRSSL